MSTTIDKRVVEMQFDNKDFEQNVQTSLSTLDKLKKGLDLSGASKGLDDVGAAAKRLDMSGVGTAVESVRMKFSALQIMAVTALTNITNQAVNAGKRIASALTIDPIKMGFQEYETQMNAVQTILANTQSKGKTLTDVNSALDELNSYADKTIYNFTEMTRNIGTFTAAGVDLDTSVAAIKGIANLAAVSGSTSQQASTAMYQLSQALASGTVKLMDWNSVVNAGMGGQVFQDALKETARVHGVAIDSLIEKEGSFRDSLSTGWLSSEILTETLSKFTGDLNEEQLKTMGYTEEQIKEIIKMGQTANDAATKVKTFTQLFDTLKEAAQSGWTQTWEIIVGDFEEAKELLTQVSNVFGEIIGNSANARNEMLQGWKDLGGRTAVIEAVKNAFEGVMSVIKPIKEAFREIFPPITAQQLYNFSVALKNITEKLILGEEQSNKLKRTFKGLFAVLDIIRMAFVAVLGLFKPLLQGTGMLGDGILGLTGSWGDWIMKLRDTIKDTQIFTKAIQKIIDVVKRVIGVIKPYAVIIAGIFAGLVESIKTVFGSIKDFLTPSADKIRNFAESIKEKFNCPGFKAFYDMLERIHSGAERVGNSVDTMKNIVINVFKKISDAITGSKIVQVLSGIWNVVKSIVGGIIKAIGNLVGGIANATGGVNFDRILEFLNALSVGGIAVGITNLVKNISKPLNEFGGILEGFKDMLGGVSDILDSVRGCFEAYQRNLKAKTLLKIASAIAILVASLLVLSLIDADKLGTAIMSIGLLFTSLMLSMRSLNNGLKKGSTDSEGGGNDGIKQYAATMLALSVSILILAAAMKSIADLDTVGLAKGIAGVASMAGVMVAAIKLISNKGQKVLKGSVGLIAFATAIKILASVCKDLSVLSWEDISKGLKAVGILMAEVAAFLLVAKYGRLSMTSAVGLVAMAAALKILASVCKDFASMSWGEIGKGLVAIAGGLVAMALAMQLMPKMMNMSSVLGIVAITAALFVLKEALEGVGSMSWSEIGKAVVVMSASLAAIAIAMNFMIAALPGAAALLIVSAALAVLATDMQLFNKLSWAEIGKGFVVMGGALLILAVGLTAMIAALPGAAALLVAASALLVLTPVLLILGTMSWESIVKGLTMLAGVFTVLGVAGLLLAPIAPIIMALAASLALIGVGIIAAGVGLNVLSIGIGALAAALVAGSTAIVAGLTVIINGVIALIPAILVAIGQGIIAILRVITEAMPVICEAVTAILLAVIKVLVACVPPLVDGLFVLLDAALNTLVEYTPKLVQSVFDILIACLDGIANNIGLVVQSAIDVVISFVNGIAQKIPDVIQMGFDLLLAFLNGIADAIENNTQKMIDAGNRIALAILDAVLAVLANGPELVRMAADRIMESGFLKGIKDRFNNVKETISDLMKKAKEAITNKISDWKNAGKDLIDGFIQGIKDKISGAVDSVKELGSNVVSGLKSVLGIHSPSRAFAEIGRYSDEGFIAGLKQYASKVSGAAEDVGDGALDAMSSAVSRITEAINDEMDADPTIRPVLDLSNIEAGTRSLNSMFSRTQAMKVSAAIDKSNSASFGSGDGTTSKTGNTYQFTQNNYSPKALSRVEIYRQTRNQFSEMERMVDA